MCSSERQQAVSHRHHFWATGLLLLIWIAMWAYARHGLPLDESWRRIQVASVAFGIAFLVGGIGYARQRQWGRRVVHISLWGVIILMAGCIGRLLHHHDYRAMGLPALGLYVAVSWACELRETGARTAPRGDSDAPSRVDVAYVLGLIGVIVVAGVATFVTAR